MSFKNKISQALIDWVNDELIYRLREELQEEDINASRRLSQSFHIDSISLEQSAIIAGVVGEAYWKYINYGVNGSIENHNAPYWGSTGATIDELREEIREWIPARGIVKPDNFATYEVFAENIVWGVIKKGKKARPFVDDAVKELNYDELRNRLITIFVNELKKKK